MAAPVTRAGGPDNIDELLTTSMENLLPGIRDNTYSSNPALKWMNSKGRLMKRGGADLSHGIMYDGPTAGRYQRYDTLGTTPVDGLTRDTWDWFQYSVPVTVDGFTERVANAGDPKIVDIVETKRRQAEEELSLLLEQDIFSASPNAKGIRSLPVIVLGTGTEGDIAAGTSTWWQSLVTASGSYAARGRSDMVTAYNSLSIRNPAGGPEFILSDQTSQEAYESSLVSQVRFQDNKLADIGLKNILFKDTAWAWSPQATSGVIYFLHSNGIEFVVNTDTDFILKPFVSPSNQDARVAHILLACALITGNRRKLGKLTGVTA